MKIRNLIKSTFFITALINLSPSGEASQFFFNDAKISSQSKNINWVNKGFPKHLYVSSNSSFQNYRSNSKDQILQIYRDESQLLVTNSLDNKNELEI